LEKYFRLLQSLEDTAKITKGGGYREGFAVQLRQHLASAEILTLQEMKNHVCEACPDMDEEDFIPLEEIPVEVIPATATPAQAEIKNLTKEEENAILTPVPEEIFEEEDEDMPAPAEHIPESNFVSPIEDSPAEDAEFLMDMPKPMEVEECDSNKSAFPSLEEAPAKQAVTVLEEPVTEPVVEQVSSRKWLIKNKNILTQSLRVRITRNGKSESVRFDVSPLKIADNGPVPVLVNAEHQTEYGAIKCITAKSCDGEILLPMDIGNYSVLIRGTFDDGRFSASVMSTGRSIESGDCIELEDILGTTGHAPVPEIQMTDKTRLWISFANDKYYGILDDGEWVDEYNASSDAMIEVDNDYRELITTLNNEEWSVEY